MEREKDFSVEDGMNGDLSMMMAGEYKSIGKEHRNRSANTRIGRHVKKRNKSVVCASFFEVNLDSLQRLISQHRHRQCQCKAKKAYQILLFLPGEVSRLRLHRRNEEEGCLVGLNRFPQFSVRLSHETFEMG